MKNLKLIALAIAITVSSVSFATTTDENPTSKLRQQIIRLLGKTSEKIANTDIVADVVFTVNHRSEIVIISVKSKNDKIESFVKSKLNNKKISVSSINEEKIYHLPLTLVNE